jgi:hypothetical protein
MSDLLHISNIEQRIFTMRGVQVMLDRDLSILYEVETRALKQAVKRNLARFPTDFMFELTEDEISVLVSQSVIPSRKHLGGAKSLAFTEQGVSSLSSVLTSTRAIEINIEIMRAFVKMRQFLSHNADLFHRLNHIEKRQIAGELKTDERFEQVFKALEDKSIKPKQGIFFDGQVFDAYAFVCDLIRAANRRIILIDNYVDESVLLLLAKRKAGVSMHLLTKTISRQLAQDIAKCNAQYPAIEVKAFTLAHDRFLIVDDDIYHIGASLKDLGKKWFAFSKMEMGAIEMLGRLRV